MITQILSVSYAHAVIPSLYIAGSLNGSTNNLISVLNTTSNTVTSTITVAGANTTGVIQVLPNNQILYCADYVTTKLFVINLATQTLVTTITSGINNGPIATATSPNGQFLYVTYRNNNSFSVINTTTNIATNYTTTVGTIGSINYIAASPDGNYIYITDANSSTVAVISTANYSALFGSFSVGTPGLGQILMGITMPSNSSSIAYVAHQTDAKIYPVTGLPSSPVVGTGITVPAEPTALIMNPANNSTAFVVNYPPSGASNISIITNINTSPVVTSYPVGTTAGSYFLAATSDGTKVYASLFVEGVLGLLNTVTNTASIITMPGVSPTVQGIGIAATTGHGVLDTTFGNQGFTLKPLSRGDSLSSSLIQTGASLDKIVVAGTTLISATGALTPSSFLAQYTTGGFLDTSSFNNTGANPGYQTLLIGTRTQANAVTLDANQNMLVAGYAIVNNLTNLFLARYNIAGSLDTTFNTVGYVTQLIGSGVTAAGVRVQSTGKIIVAGTSVNSGVPAFTIARFTSTGALDSGTFGTGGITTTNIGNISIIKAIIVDSSDKIVVAGVVDNKMTIARYTAAGILDTSFNTTGILQPSITGVSSSTAYDVGLDASGNILIAGSVVQSGVTQSLLMRITTAGALDTSFNTTGYVIQSISSGSAFYSLAVQSNTSIVAGGYAISPLTNQISLARYLGNGTLDGSYGSAGITLTSIGSIAAAQALGLQTTQNCIAAGTADGTFCVSRFTV
jgi:uncharacterized delta-60 repeat protein